MRVRVAWALLVVSGACAVADTVLSARHGSLLSQDIWVRHGWPLVSLATLGSALMGALIVSRHPRHPIGWLLVVAGISSISVAAEAYSLWPPFGDGHAAVVAAHVAGWVSGLLGAPLALTAVILLFLLAPDGHLASQRWRWVASTAVVGYLLYAASIIGQAPARYDIDQRHPSAGTQLVISAGVLLGIASLVTATAGLVLRLRRAEGDLRRQLLWVAVSAAMLATAFIWLVGLTASGCGCDDNAASSAPLYVAYLSIPVCTAVAVLRHRLLDIDIIVNRALVVFLATVLAGGAYVLAVVVLGAALGGTIGYWPSLLATAVIALHFQPLRLRVVRLADRLAFGAAAEPYDALAVFSRRLGESPDPSDLLAAFAEAAGEVVSARRLEVTLDLPFGAETAQWPSGTASGAGPTTVIPVADGEEHLGSLTVELAPGHALRTSDTALLHDLADQAVVAFRNARLAAELASRVAELDAQTRALEESRRRLISAADAERSRLERAVTREVAAHLEQLPDQLCRLAEAPLTAEQVQPLRAEAEQALEALRGITRGVFPAQLGRAGLEPALRSLVARTNGATLHVSEPEGLPRSPASVEAAAYFCVAEAVRDLGSPVDVRLVRNDDGVGVAVEGGDAGELSLATMRDRVEALGGTLASGLSADRRCLDVWLPVAAVVMT